MANTLITPTVIAKTALATLYNATVFVPLVWRDFDADYEGAQRDTVTIRKPATFTANDFTSTITVQDATETSTSVTLDTISDVSFAVTAKELSLNLEAFEERLVAPAMEALAQKVDGELAEALVDAAETSGGGGSVTWSSSTASTVFTGELGAVSKLGRNKIPVSDRHAVFSPEGAGVCLKDSLFVEADKSGSTDALRDASLGRVFGFETYMSQALGSTNNDAGQADGIAFHRHAVALVTRPLAAPLGAEQAAIAEYKGLGLRVVKSYDISTKKDIVSVDLLYGIDTLRKEAAVQLSFGIGS
mgnify:FL=1